MIFLFQMENPIDIKVDPEEERELLGDNKDEWPAEGMVCPVTMCLGRGRFRRYGRLMDDWGRFHARKTRLAECIFCGARFARRGRARAHALQAHGGDAAATMVRVCG